MAASSPPAKKACNHETGSGEEEDPAVSLFREYVRIPSVSRGEDYLKHYGIYREHKVAGLLPANLLDRIVQLKQSSLFKKWQKA